MRPSLLRSRSRIITNAENKVETVFRQIREANSFKGRSDAAKPLGDLVKSEALEGVTDSLTPVMETVKAQITPWVYSKSPDERLTALIVTIELLEATSLSRCNGRSSS